MFYRRIRFAFFHSHPICAYPERERKPNWRLATKEREAKVSLRLIFVSGIPKSEVNLDVYVVRSATQAQLQTYSRREVSGSVRVLAELIVLAFYWECWTGCLEHSQMSTYVRMYIHIKRYFKLYIFFNGSLRINSCTLFPAHVIVSFSKPKFFVFLLFIVVVGNGFKPVKRLLVLVSAPANTPPFLWLCSRFAVSVSPPCRSWRWRRRLCCI